MSDTIATENVAAEQTTQESNGAAAVTGKEFKFFFKTEKVKDAEGKEVGEGKKHPDVKAILPVPSRDELIVALSNGDSKEAKLIVELVEQAVADAARAQINETRENKKDANGNLGEFKATDFDLTKLTLTAIANMPKGQRGAWAPSDEDHKDFAELYKQVLIHRMDYDPKKTQTHCDHYKSGFAKVKTNKQVLAKLQEFLVGFASKVEEEEMEEVQQTYDWLTNRVEKYLKAEERNLLEAL